MAALATVSGGDLYGDFDAEARKRLWARDSETAGSNSSPGSRLSHLDARH
jgi:hypothetical protein